MANKGKPKFPTFFLNHEYYKNNDFWMLKRKNPLKQGQSSPIWTKLCPKIANMIIQKFSKPEGLKYPNKGLNRDFLLKKIRKNSNEAILTIGYHMYIKNELAQPPAM